MSEPMKHTLAPRPDAEVDTLLQRHACRTSLGTLRDELASGYPVWQTRRHRAAVARRYAFAACVLLVVGFASNTVTTHSLPRWAMNVTVPMHQNAMFNLSSQTVSLLWS